MANWLDIFYDDFWDALSEIDMKKVEQRAWQCAQECADRVTNIPTEREVAAQAYYNAYMLEVVRYMGSTKLRAAALKARGRG